jgi:hypothetical protein
MSDLIPQHGARVLLDLQRAGDAEIVYRVELHAPEASFAGVASLEVASGKLALGPWTVLRGEGEPEAWMVDGARAFLRTLYKNHVQERDWPRRQLRWRERRV